jgi:hypothetical protein
MANGQPPFIPGISAASAAPAQTPAPAVPTGPTVSPASIAPSPVMPVSPVTISKEQMDFLNQRFNDVEGGPAPIVAKSIVGELQQSVPDLFTYQSLKDGTAPLFEVLPQFQGKEPEQRKLTDNQIIRLLARDTEGNKIEEGSFFEGMRRELLPQSAGFGGAYTGARIGYQLQQAIPPVNPAAVAVKFAIPVATTTIGFLGGYSGGREATDFLIGPEAPLLPGTTASYEAGKTAMGALSWMPLPFLISKNVSFGGAQLLDNVASLKALRSPVGPPTKEAMPGYQAAIAEYQAGREALGSGAEKLLNADKGPRSTRLIRIMEGLLSRTGEGARAAPKFTLGIEGIAAVGQTKMAQLAEEGAPGDVGVRIGAEVTGALTPSVFGAVLASKLPVIGTVLKQTFKKGGLKKAAEPILQYRENQVVRKILDALENSGEDVDSLIETLADPKFLTDEKGDPIQLTAGAKTGSPTLLAFEQAADQLSGGALAKERVKGANKAVDAYKVLIYAMMSTGDQDALQQAADLAQEFFAASIQSRIGNATDNLLNAVDKVAGEQPVGNMELSERLFNLLDTQLGMARQKERQLWRAIPDEEITVFKDSDGNVVDYPQFLDRWIALLPQTEEAQSPILRKLSNLNQYVMRKRGEFGLDTDGVAAAAPDVDPLARFNFGKEVKPTDKRLAGVELPEGYRVFQRSEEVPGVAGKVSTTSVVDPNGNRVDLTRDPENKIFPYQADFVDGAKDTMQGKDQASELVAASNLAQAVDAVAKTMSQGRVRFSRTPIDEVADDAAGAVPTTDTPSITVQELEEIRSSALSLGRELQAAGDLNGARVAFGLGEAILRDMNNFDVATTSAYHTARAYSKALNDTFTRAFAGDVMDTTRKGAERIAPELLSTKLAVGGSDATYLRIDQIQGVGRFAKENGFEGAEDAVASIDGTVLSLLRNARAAATDPTTGEINIRMLDKWRRENKPLLDIFPGLSRDLEDSRKAQLLLNEERLAEKAASKALQGQVTFKNLLSGYTENPTTAVAEALANSNKRKWPSMNALLDVAQGRNLERATGTEGFALPEAKIQSAMNGLKTSVLEWGMTKAGGTAGSGFKPSVAYRAFFEPIEGERTGGSLVDWMVSNKVMPKKEADNLKTMLQEMMRFEVAQVNGTIEDIVEQAGPLLDFYLRVTGSNLGAKASGILGGGGGDLIARSAGSKIMRQAFEDVPEAFQIDVMTKMMQDPEFLAAMLRRGVTEREKLNIANRAAGMVYDFFGRPTRRVAPSVGRETMEDEVEQPTPEPQASVQAPRQNLMAQRFARSQPTVIQPRPAAPVAQPAPQPAPAPAPAPPQGAANPQQRQQLAAMFPNDPILGAAGGIGSLFS